MLGKKKKGEEAAAEVKKSGHVKATLAGRNKDQVLDPHLREQFLQGRLYAALASRPGQSGRADGYILEGKELDFYLRKVRRHPHAPDALRAWRVQVCSHLLAPCGAFCVISS
jgi:small subunit ribosomal protein S8e